VAEVVLAQAVAVAVVAVLVVIVLLQTLAFIPEFHFLLQSAVVELVAALAPLQQMV
jgi:hypothetical protein